MMLPPLWRVFTSRPMYLIYLVTARCQLRCPACFNWQRQEAAAPAQELTPDEVYRFGRTLPRLYQLTFGGGEPFLRDDLAELVSAMAEATDAPSLSVATNGWDTATVIRCTEQILAANRRRFLRVQVSLDGPAAVHDRLRGAGSHARALATLAGLAALQRAGHRLAVDVNTCVSRDNLDVMRPLIDEVRDAGLTGNHTLSLVRGTPRDPASSAVPPDAYAAVLEYLRGAAPAPERRPFSALVRATVRRANDLAWQSAAAGRQLIPCRAGHALLSLFEGGTLAPCELLGRTYGNIRDAGYDFRRIATTPAYRDTGRFIARGGCTCSWECALAASLPLHPSSLPRLLANALRRCR